MFAQSLIESFSARRFPSTPAFFKSSSGRLLRSFLRGEEKPRSIILKNLSRSIFDGSIFGLLKTVILRIAESTFGAGWNEFAGTVPIISGSPNTFILSPSTDSFFLSVIFSATSF